MRCRRFSCCRSEPSSVFGSLLLLAAAMLVGPDDKDEPSQPDPAPEMQQHEDAADAEPAHQLPVEDDDVPQISVRD